VADRLENALAGRAQPDRPGAGLVFASMDALTMAT